MKVETFPSWEMSGCDTVITRDAKFKKLVKYVRVKHGEPGNLFFVSSK